MQDLEEVLSHYGVKGSVTANNDGPIVKLVEFKPEPGTKIKNITTSLNDIARELGSPSLRVEAIEENGTIGFEFPQKNRKIVDFSELLQSPEFMGSKAALPIIPGVNITGKPVIADLAKMPHLLVAGTTGSGKSVGLNTFILSLIAKRKPADLQFVMIDPKRIEFAGYNNQKYMLFPVVTEMSDAANALAYLVEEMERRYALFEEHLTKNISDYNSNDGHLPYIVCVIDEFADLMAADKNVEAHILRLAQKARAAGIHIILATQRPSVDIVTGVIKANFPNRLAYKTAGATDSRTIIDVAGAEKLLGSGDALFLTTDGTLKRVHGGYIADDEISSLLAPFRGKVSGFPFSRAENKPVKKAEKSSPGFFRRIWNFWSSLRQKDKKLIINGIFFLLGQFSGKTQTRKKRK